MKKNLHKTGQLAVYYPCYHYDKYPMENFNQLDEKQKNFLMEVMELMLKMDHKEIPLETGYKKLIEKVDSHMHDKYFNKGL